VKLRTGLAAVLLTLASSASAAVPATKARACHLPGMEESLRCQVVDVPSDYTKPAGAKIGIHVTIAPAYRESASKDPLFILAGGPGQAGSDVISVVNSAFRRARATRDIILIDQRGTGRSGKLDCESRPEHETMSEDELLKEVGACVAKLGKPWGDYSTANSARDIEEVRKALGYGQVNVFGASYGTRLGQAYGRMFPASVRTLVLDGVAAPEQVIPAGGKDGQAALDRLFQQCDDNAPCAKAFPNLRAEFAALVQRVNGDKLVLDIANPRTAQASKVKMTSSRFLRTVHSVLYSPVDSRRLPFLLHSAFEGRWEPFIARSNVATDFSADGDISFVMNLAVTCAEDYPRLTPELLIEDGRNSFMQQSMIERGREFCKLLNVAPAAAIATSRLDMPILMMSGALDPVTPPHRAEAAAKQMPRAQHIVVSNAGHGIASLGCAPRLLREFLDKPEAPVQAACMKELPTPTFQLGAAGPQP
jgi:pimeloyl-ACP methyl ester carboxylesterase